MQRTVALFLLTAMGLVTPAAAEEPQFLFPLIKGYGGVVALPQAAEPPRSGAKIVFDITADSKPDEVNRGLESVARYLNLNAQAGHRPNQVRLALVLHGSATRCALQDEAYREAARSSVNPNLPLLAELKKHGVELFVCGQSLARNKFASSQVAGDVAIAASAMTVSANKQLDGYAYLTIR